ncbi:hypothetical protein OSB04_030305 [Centaurea solstitialis]|uniref:Protein kinase domain-containing protein n=1 Tax=Centaurea solstitialis TaxID=347529 RepID=A0AA38VWK3_9ASTR|nr:hypothetical protein OSB04_030305 [Centaurea solstitialis]
MGGNGIKSDQWFKILTIIQTALSGTDCGFQSTDNTLMGLAETTQQDTPIHDLFIQVDNTGTNPGTGRTTNIMAFLDEFQHLKIELEKIQLATDNFADNKAIGVGGFGKVYKGEICHSKGKSMAAFKRLDGRMGQGNSEFWKEIMMLSRYTHENLVSLLGYCDEGGEKVLVYEYASRGSLDFHLSAATLTWIQRLKICLGVARALRYLHDPDGTQQRVIHRDIKSANILLDENWNAKVSDLGLSKIGPANQQHTALISNVAGTLGYLDPMYLKMGLLTKESDVYSFGVVLFEALCGRLCFEHNNGQYQSLVRMWKKSYEQKKLEEIIFRDLMQKMNPRSLETFSDVAYLCLQESREERPRMAYVVEKLEIALQLQEMYQLMVLLKEYKEILDDAVTHQFVAYEVELKRLLSEGILINDGKLVIRYFFKPLFHFKYFYKPIFTFKKGKSLEYILGNLEIKFRSSKTNPGHNSILKVYSYVSFFSAPSCQIYGGLLSRKRKENIHNRCQSSILVPRNHIHSKRRVQVFRSMDNPDRTYIVRFTKQVVGETKSSSWYTTFWRENGWMSSDLYPFTSYGINIDLDFRFDFLEMDISSSNIIKVEGMQLRVLPPTRVSRQMLVYYLHHFSLCGS